MNRFVWDEYTWNPDPNSPFTEFNGKLIPSRIPLSALISGKSNSICLIHPTHLGSRSDYRWPFSSESPISFIDIQEIIPSHMPRTSDHRWSIHCRRIAPGGQGATNGNHLRKMGEIATRIGGEVYRNRERIFPDFQLLVSAWCCSFNLATFNAVFSQFGSPEILEIWPSLQNSPILSEFGWSPLINDAFLKNQIFFSGKPPSLSSRSFSLLNSFYGSWKGKSSDKNSLKTVDTSAVIPGLLALHIRRGDFAEHCNGLFDWSSTWNGFNHFPGLPDRFDMPEDSEERREEYRRRCYPNVTEIAAKVRKIVTDRELEQGSSACSRFNNKKLKRIYVMTNGHESWIEELKTALHADMPDYWEAIHSSRDLTLTWEQRFVAQALDMLVAERADVFVGNGVCAL
jgi:hypothetical protein